MQKQMILLPVTNSGTPDYDFMEQYIKEREQKITQNYISFIDNDLQEEKTPLSLEQKKWNTFVVGDLDHKLVMKNNTSLVQFHLLHPVIQTMVLLSAVCQKRKRFWMKGTVLQLALLMAVLFIKKLLFLAEVVLALLF